MPNSRFTGTQMIGMIKDTGQAFFWFQIQKMTTAPWATADWNTLGLLSGPRCDASSAL